MSAPDFAKVLWDHLSSDAERECIDGEWIWARRCDCGWVGLSEAHIDHQADALSAALAEWLGDEGTREVVARAMSGPHWWAEDDNGIGDEIRQSIREDAAAALAVLTTHRHDGVREGGDHG